jgi:hypothetical protein
MIYEVRHFDVCKRYNGGGGGVCVCVGGGVNKRSVLREFMQHAHQHTELETTLLWWVVIYALEPMPAEPRLEIIWISRSQHVILILHVVARDRGVLWDGGSRFDDL